MLKHTLRCAIDNDCGHGMQDVVSCVVCGKTLKESREHFDVCGEPCYRELLKAQRRWTLAHENA